MYLSPWIFIEIMYPALCGIKRDSKFSHILKLFESGTWFFLYIRVYIIQQYVVRHDETWTSKKNKNKNMTRVLVVLAIPNTNKHTPHACRTLRGRCLDLAHETPFEVAGVVVVGGGEGWFARFEHLFGRCGGRLWGCLHHNTLLYRAIYWGARPYIVDLRLFNVIHRC